jgi:hypothetical protein
VVAQLAEAVRHKTEVSGSSPGGILGNFLVTNSFCPHSVAVGSTQPLREIKRKVVYIQDGDNVLHLPEWTAL